MAGFFFILMALYLLVIGALIYGFNRLPVFECDNRFPTTQFSIVVPFRNEATNLPVLLDSFSKLNYPVDWFEVLLIDDDSDIPFEVPKFDFEVSILKNQRFSNSPKKDAIQTAIQHLGNSWIVCTDADCVVPHNWLRQLDAFIQKQQPEMVVGAVNYETKNQFIHHFQQLDLASLQGATLGSFGIKKGFMCNGANFAYTKKLFLKLNGFQGNNHIASGDDVFLLQKAIKVCPEKVAYLKTPQYSVSTKPLDNWHDLFQQRVRWASKTGAYDSSFAKLVALVVFLTNLIWLFSLLLVALGWFSSFQALLLFLIKMIADAVLICKTNRFFKAKTQHLFFGALLYPFFSVGVAVYSFFGKYNWKGRRFGRT